MTSLRELQRSFVEGVLRNNTAVAARTIRDNGIAPARRISIYRNNAVEGFLKTMQATFPVVSRLSGEEWFRQTVRSYMEQHPSRSGNIHFIGEKFASYLEVELYDSPYLYFADVARLEWLYQEVLVAADHPGFDLKALAHVGPDAYSAIRFQIRPALRLLDAAFPVLAIWQANQPDAPDTQIELISGTTHTMIIRRDTHVEMRELSVGHAALLRGFVDRLSFGEAADAALDADPALDLAAALTYLVQLQTFVDFSVDPQ
ncbi:MAG: putative DNA-binding domain-containing protein [Povalibacter sp.]